MKKRMLRILAIAIAVIVLIACAGGGGTKSAMANVEKMIEKAEKQKNDLTLDEWKQMNEQVDKEFEVLNAALEADQLGAMDKLKLISISARWMAVTAKTGLDELENETGMTVEELGEQLQQTGEKMEESAAKVEEAAQNDSPEQASKELQDALKQLSDIMGGEE